MLGFNLLMNFWKIKLFILIGYFVKWINFKKGFYLKNKFLICVQL